MERVALAVSVIPDGRGDKVSAIGGNHASLSEAGARIRILNCRVNADKSYEDAKSEVEGNEELVECAA